MLESKSKGIAFMVAASLCWSFGGVCIKFIPWDAMSIIGLRAILAAGVFAVYRKSVRLKLTKGNVLAALCLSGTTVLFVFANKLTSAAAAICLQFSAPIFIILIEYICYKKVPRIGEVLAVIAATAGMLLFFAGELEGGALIGNIFAIGSGLAFAGVFVCNNRPDTAPEDSLFLGFLINSAIGLPFAFFNVTANPLAWGMVVFLGIVQVGIAYMLFSMGIKRTPALLACLISALEPILNPVWVMLFANETPGIFALMGGIVIIVTVVAYNIWAQKADTQQEGERYAQ